VTVHPGGKTGGRGVRGDGAGEGRKWMSGRSIPRWLTFLAYTEDGEGKGEKRGQTGMQTGDPKEKQVKKRRKVAKKRGAV